MAYDAHDLATRVVASGLGVSEWCESEGGGIGKTSVYRALNWCRVNEPEVFGAGADEARASDGSGQWYVRVMAAMAGGPASQPEPFVRIDAPEQLPAARAAGIVVEIGGARVTLPAGSAASDVQAALAAVAMATGVAR
jgi:hypothetical protein